MGVVSSPLLTLISHLLNKNGPMDEKLVFQVIPCPWWTLISAWVLLPRLDSCLRRSSVGRKFSLQSKIIPAWDPKQCGGRGRIIYENVDDDDDDDDDGDGDDDDDDDDEEMRMRRKMLRTVMLRMITLRKMRWRRIVLRKRRWRMMMWKMMILRRMRMRMIMRKWSWGWQGAGKAERT